MRATIYLNVTTHQQAHERGTAGECGYSPTHATALAIFLRIGAGSYAAKGDLLQLVGTFELAATSARQVAEEAFALGNGARPDSEDYYAAGVRSFSCGDVVVVETADGPATFICESCGFSEDLTLHDFQLV